MNFDFEFWIFSRETASPPWPHPYAKAAQSVAAIHRGLCCPPCYPFGRIISTFPTSSPMRNSSSMVKAVGSVGLSHHAGRKMGYPKCSHSSLYFRMSGTTKSRCLCMHCRVRFRTCMRDTWQSLHPKNKEKQYMHFLRERNRWTARSWWQPKVVDMMDFSPFRYKSWGHQLVGDMAPGCWCS